MKLLSLLFLASLAYAFEEFPGERDMQTAGWFVNVSKSVRLPALSKSPIINLNKLENKIDELSELSNRISKDPQAINLIRRIHKGFLGTEGKTLRQMLVLAAQDSAERDALIRAVQYERGLLLWPGFDLVGEKFWSGSPKVSFTQSQLKSDMDALEQRLFPNASPPEWLKDLKASDLDIYEPYFKLFLELEPKSNELLAFAVHYLQFLSCQSTLKGFFESLNLWFTDKTNGLASILVGAKPRTARGERS